MNGKHVHCPECGSILPVATTLGGRLRHCRMGRKATLRDVEAATGVSNAVVSQIETGKVGNPGVFTIARLAAYYGVTVESLIDGVPQES